VSGVQLGAQEPEPADPLRLTIEAERTADRLRSFSAVRLRAGLPGGDTRAGRAFGLAQQLADRTAELAGWPQRVLPLLPDTCAGDVLAVCAADLVEVLEACPPSIAALLSAEACTDLVAVRRVL
jgi:hypothetical protein